MTLMEVGLDDKYRLGCEADIPVRHAGAGPVARCCSANATARRGSTPPASSPAIAARRSACTTTRCGARNPPQAARHRVRRPASTRTWRPPRCGAASRSACSRAPRSMACSASGTARAPASTARSTRSSTPTPPAPRCNGGVLALAGDDHGCQSSTLAHQSEQVFAAALMPVLNPATLQDYLDLGLSALRCRASPAAGSASRRSRETVESSALDRTAIPIASRSCMPDDFEMPPGGLRHPLAGSAAGRRSGGCSARRWQAVQAFARANQLDRIVLDSKPARLGIIATGKAYLDLRQALADLGITDKPRRRTLGLRIYKVALTWPLEETGAQRFAEGLQDVLVVEEKRGFIEDQLLRILYNVDASRRPSVVGKRDETRRAAAAERGRADADHGRGRRGRRGCASSAIAARRWSSASPQLEAFDRPADGIGADQARSARRIFCSGCPHNTSTKVPEGSRAMAGIGCHGMALSVPSRRTDLISHMGARGRDLDRAGAVHQRAARVPESRRRHLHPFRLAGASRGVGRRRQHHLQDPLQRRGRDDRRPARRGRLQRRADRAPGLGRGRQAPRDRLRRSREVSDGNYFPPGATIHHRRELDAVQRELRDIKGLTVLIYDQTCAAESAAAASAGSIPIRPSAPSSTSCVCEGCGDCSQASNCVSVQPLETEFGRKRRIDQSNCNKDFSCVEGFCPSFVTVHGGSLKRIEDLRGRSVGSCSPICRCRLRRALDGALQHPRHRHRRHRRHHHRRAARHGRPCRRPRLLGAGLHRPVAEERRGHEPCPHRAAGRRIISAVRIAHRRRRPHPRLRHDRRGQRPARSAAPSAA